MKHKKNSISFNRGYELGVEDTIKNYQPKIDILVAELSLMNEIIAIKDTELKMKKNI